LFSRIHAEWIRNLAANTQHVSVDRLEVTRDRMTDVLPQGNVRGYQSLIPELDFPDPDDRHVPAAPINGKATLIVS